MKLKQFVRKYFLLIIFILGLTGFLGFQVTIDTMESLADQSDIESSLQYTPLVDEFNNSNLIDLFNQELNIEKNDVVVINFWASWCKPCLTELNTLQEVKKENPNLKVVTINIETDQPTDFIKDTVKKKNWGFYHFMKKELPLKLTFEIERLPLSVVFKNGKIEMVNSGFYDFHSKEFQTYLK
jgi:thiol-disulfide isomerase/thioredoxin